MYISVITVILMLLSVHGCYGDERGPQDVSFNCDRYIDYMFKEYTCRPRGFFTMFVIGDDVLQGDDLVQEINLRCSNVTAIEAYFNCMNEIEADCPEQLPLVRDGSQRKLDMFCDGTDVSSWLSTRLQNGFTFNLECAAVSRELMTNCSTKVLASYSHVDGSVTLSAALEIIPSIISQLFQCTKTEFSQQQASFQDCGSTWRDMLLIEWLRLFATSSFGVHMANTEILVLLEELQELEVGGIAS